VASPKSLGATLYSGEQLEVCKFVETYAADHTVKMKDHTRKIAT
jgi:hypothetical protein